MDFYSKIFPLRRMGLHGSPPGIAPNTPRAPRSEPHPIRFPAPVSDSRHRAPETQKGGRISPAAKRFPLSLFRETVKPPLFNDDAPGRNGRCLETPYYSVYIPPLLLSFILTLRVRKWCPKRPGYGYLLFTLFVM